MYSYIFLSYYIILWKYDLYQNEIPLPRQINFTVYTPEMVTDRNVLRRKYQKSWEE